MSAISIILILSLSLTHSLSFGGVFLFSYSFKEAHQPCFSLSLSFIQNHPSSHKVLLCSVRVAYLHTNFTPRFFLFMSWSNIQLFRSIQSLFHKCGKVTFWHFFLFAQLPFNLNTHFYKRLILLSLSGTPCVCSVWSNVGIKGSQTFYKKLPKRINPLTILVCNQTPKTLGITWDVFLLFYKMDIFKKCP